MHEQDANSTPKNRFSEPAPDPVLDAMLSEPRTSPEIQPSVVTWAEEPVDEPFDYGKFATQRSKTVKTVEAAMRAFDDLQHICPRNDDHADAIEICKRSLEIARAWK